MLTLQTERLILRDFRPNDFAAFYATSDDPEYQQFYSKRETSRAFWQALFERILSATQAPERTQYQLAVCLHTGELVGTCGVRIEVPEHQQASFGCAIARPSWGKGLAYEAASHLIDYGFSSLPIHRLYAETIRENKRARALAEKLGMRVEGELQHHKFFQGRWWDTIIYAVLKEEWNAREPRLANPNLLRL
jgi:RimJ/RimL family protein N-acetyltransferase